MANKIFWIFFGFDVVFLLCAGLHLLIPLKTHASMGREPTLYNVASDLLLDHCPLTASMVNAGVMIVAFLVSLPAMFLKADRRFLTAQAWLVVTCALFTLVIGLEIWFSTLETHKNLAPIWEQQSTLVQSMLQYKFKCCGYDNPSMFIKDQVCPSASVAAQLGSCAVPFGAFANMFLDVVFTTFFGFVAIDMMLLLSILCLLKDRKERARYKFIDEKQTVGPI